jgi:SAM-dependent methyltransferase
MKGLRMLLAEPGSLDLDIDDPATTLYRAELIRRKPFLWTIYAEWYSLITGSIPAGTGKILELGSGAGFLRESVPGLITSEVFMLPGLSAVLDGRALPFSTGSLRAIVMTDVLHHIPDVRMFFGEAIRALHAGGRIIMVEPWVTTWSRVVYGRLHHEPFRPGATEWEFPSDGPLSGANGALPWMIFQRDRKAFAASYPQLQVIDVRPMMPFRYLLSGGVSMRAVVPASSFGAFRRIERALTPLMRFLAMFAFITIERVNPPER